MTIDYVAIASGIMQPLKPYLVPVSSDLDSGPLPFRHLVPLGAVASCRAIQYLDARYIIKRREAREGVISSQPSIETLVFLREIAGYMTAGDTSDSPVRYFKSG